MSDESSKKQGSSPSRLKTLEKAFTEFKAEADEAFQNLESGLDDTVTELVEDGLPKAVATELKKQIPDAIDDAFRSATRGTDHAGPVEMLHSHEMRIKRLEGYGNSVGKKGRPPKP